MSNHGHTVYYYCKQCLHAYKTQELLDDHATGCCHAQRIKFRDDPRCRITNMQTQLPPSFVIYADTESILKPVEKDVDTTQDVEVGGESSSHVFKEHIPFSLTYHVVSSVDSNCSRPLVIYRGDFYVICSRKLSSCLTCEYIATPKPMLLTATELRSFNNATTCHICTKPLGDDKV